MLLTWLGGVVVLAAVFVALAYLRRPYWGWVLGGAYVLGMWWLSGPSVPVLFWIVVGIFAFAALLGGVVPLRRALVTAPAMPAISSILPKMSDTERAALEAGTVWWDRELFGGAPRWGQLLAFQCRDLDARERAFLSKEVSELCAQLDDHRVTRDGDLPPEVWTAIKRSGLMGMIIPRSFGGLEFSARMQSAVVARLSSRCVTAAVTVMVPNSLGPAELILHYGTDAQKNHWLPRLARGEEVPCFALTEPYAGSDAASMRSVGIVCRGTFDGREVLGMRLTWDKRYITLAPVATVLGLAFKLRDPERLLGGEEELGITCALIPTATPGVEFGERHDPLDVPFMNGPTRGSDVFVPLEFIIGGPKMAGRGWTMLMQCLAAGRGVSLPALSTGAAELATRVVGAHATIREQFGLPIGRFEGIEAKLGRIAGLTYTIDAARKLTLGALDAGEKPAVVTAIMKAYTTEAMRVVVNDAMDVVGGGGICRGPRNTLAHAYQSLPIGITVEGANVLTRSMIVFGQGAIRCHPWVQEELAAADARDLVRFDRAFWGHVGLVFTNAARALLLGLSDGALADAPVRGAAAPYFQKLSRYSAAFGIAADTAMGTLGASLKRKENLSGRLADALAWLYIGSAVLKRFVDEGQPDSRRAAFLWSMDNAVFEIERALTGLFDNLPLRWVALGLRWCVFPLGARAKPPSDRRTSEVARGILDDGALRLALTETIYVPDGGELGLGFLEATLDKVMAAKDAREKLKEAQRRKVLPRGAVLSVLQAAVEKGVLGPDDAQRIRDAEAARDAAVQVDSFEGRELLRGR
ncbi:MAG: acyl-CoA dehydrogenase [Planctomycetes bacterium]|nr:acyl-CoA dehydrogenase [Planctomycetota bacterium]